MVIFKTCGSGSWGGLEMDALKIARGLMNAGNEVYFLCAANSTLEKEATEQGVPVFPCFDSDIHFIKVVYRIKKLLDELKPEIVHTHLSHDLWTLVPALRFSGSDSRLILTKSMGSSVKKKDPFHRLLYSRVDRILALTNYVRMSVERTCPIGSDKVIVFPNAIPIKEFQPERYNRNQIRQSFGIGPDEIVIGLTGRFTPMKGHREFLGAAKLLIDRVKSPLKFLVVGGASEGEDEFRKEILKLTADSGLTECVIFAGFRKDVKEMMAVMDILAFPSHKEAFGNVLIEAMAMSLPVVAADAGGVPDTVVNGSTGILVPPKDADALADGLQKLIDNPDLRKKMGAQGRERVEQNYDFSKFIERLLENYRSIKAVNQIN
jgi:glycosyltransferase involved in cell wall biosynthesis